MTQEHEAASSRTSCGIADESCHAVSSRFSLRLGYFVVRNPSPVELADGMNEQDASKKESDFFMSVGSALAARKERRFINHVLLLLKRLFVAYIE